MTEFIALLIFFGIIFWLVRQTVDYVKKGAHIFKYGYFDKEDWENRNEVFTQNNGDFEDF